MGDREVVLREQALVLGLLRGVRAFEKGPE
jgi:hypothetical protein